MVHAIELISQDTKKNSDCLIRNVFFYKCDSMAIMKYLDKMIQDQQSIFFTIFYFCVVCLLIDEKHFREFHNFFT
jgi:hypothetical protein